jgi:hypothetical protein
VPRYPITPKTIHGKPVPQDEYLRVIATTLKALGGGKAADLLPALGPEWDTPDQRQALATTLANMANRGTIQRDPAVRGRFTVGAAFERRGVSIFDEFESGVLDVIRKKGGVCRWRDIADAYGVRTYKVNREETMNDSTYRRLTDVLARSTRIRQDFLKRGVYNLPWDELQTMPLMGRLAHLGIRIAVTDAMRKHPDGYTPREADDIVEAEQRRFYARVGGQFEMLRKTAGMTAVDVISQSPIKAAMLMIKRTGHQEVARARTDWFDYATIAEREMRAAGAPQSEISAYMAEQTEMVDRAIPRILYRRFELGKLGAHMHAPAQLYTAFAEMFDVCPVLLSRGVGMARPDQTVRLRPESTNYLDYS